ncbi:hypothetical protein FB451DRAFT_1184377 [Mycena latifolia]|nr:hypothetical protein FB451DRAFT_1184377 [Mycena latifolia]
MSTPATQVVGTASSSYLSLYRVDANAIRRQNDGPGTQLPIEALAALIDPTLRSARRHLSRRYTYARGCTSRRCMRAPRADVRGLHLARQSGSRGFRMAHLTRTSAAVHEPSPRAPAPHDAILARGTRAGYTQVSTSCTCASPDCRTTLRADSVSLVSGAYPSRFGTRPAPPAAAPHADLAVDHDVPGADQASIWPRMSQAVRRVQLESENIFTKKGGAPLICTRRRIPSYVPPAILRGTSRKFPGPR